MTVEALLRSVPDAELRDDCRSLVTLMSEVTGSSATLWGPALVGFGRYHWRYDSGREGDHAKIGFSPRPARITIYVMSGMVGYEDLLERLGKHRRGKSTIHIRRLADVDREVLKALLARSVRHLDETERDRGAIPRMSQMPPWKDDS